METFIKDKKLNSVVLFLLIIISLYFVAKFVNEIKMNKYIGDETSYSNVIYVKGKGEVKAIPDIASISISISEEGKTSKEAQNLLNKSINKTLNYLKKQKIDEKDIKSQYGGINPKYSYNNIVCIRYPCPQKEPKITGYTATQSITVKVRKVDDANEIRSGLSNLDIKNINGPTFSIDDMDVYKDQARAIAIKNAKDKAEVLVKSLGVKLGKITNFSESGGGNYPTLYKSTVVMEDAVSLGAPIPELPKGENTITSNVTITYQIR